MIFNLIKISLRHHVKNKVHSLINVFGLALGMACFALLTLLVKSELSHDQYHADKELIYQVYAPLSEASGLEYADQFMAPAGPLFVNAVPEVTQSVRFQVNEGVAARVNNNRVIIPKLFCTDQEALDFFSLDFMTSTTTQVELGTDGIVISKSAAERLFGSAEEALGKAFEVIDYKEFIIKGVFEDVPENSHLAFDYLITFDHVNALFHLRTGSNWDFLGWRAGGYPTYIKLKAPVEDLASIETKLKEAMAPHHAKNSVTLVPLDEIYFSDWNRSYFKAAGDDSYLNLYIFIGLIILIVAIVNYTNLSTASFIKRAKEVGIRKALGGQRSQLIHQFMAESFILVVISSVLAICLFELVVPVFNVYTGKEIGIDYTSFSTYGVFIGFLFLISFIAGIYPAFFLSAFSPRQGMSMSTQGQGRGLFRKFMVGFQFMACLALMVVTGIVFEQHSHLNELNPGFNKELVVGIPLKDERLKEAYTSFKNELLSNPQIKAVAGASINIFKEEFRIETEVENGKRLMINWVMVEENFQELLEIEKAQGRLLSEIKEGNDGGAMILNEAAVELLGWEKPLEESIIEAQVKGVMKDFIFGSGKEVITPLMISEGTAEDFGHAYVRINGNVSAVLDHIESTFNNFSQDYPFEYEFLDDQFAAKYESEKKLGEAFAVFSILTLFIAGLGVLGLSVFIAETRTKEIGIRKVLGAGVQRIIWLLNGGITFLILGVGLVTLPVVYYFMEVWLQDFAFRVELGFQDFILPWLMLLAAVWSILLYQSLKSASLNPVEALKAE